MSGPSIAVRRRWREQVARFVAKNADTYLHEDAAAVEDTAAGLLSGEVLLNVRGAKTAARELIALEAEQAAFEDWTRDRGMGPEAKHGHQLRYRWLYVRSSAGLSALEDECWEGGVHDYARSTTAMVLETGGGWPGKLARDWPGDRRAPMGRSLARLGRRVLEALEGQPDACEAEGCYGGATAFGRDVREYFERLIDERSLVTPLSLERIGCEVDNLLRRHGHDGRAQAVADGSQITLLGFDEGLARCPDCHGTGDNLRGVLPEVVETRQEREQARRRFPRTIGRELAGEARRLAAGQPGSRAAIAWSLGRVRVSVADLISHGMGAVEVIVSGEASDETVARGIYDALAVTQITVGDIGADVDGVLVRFTRVADESSSRVDGDG